MKKYLCLFSAACILSACGGSEVTFVGATIVTPDSNGAVLGVDTEDLTVVQSDIGGYVYGLATDVDALVIGNSAGRRAGDNGSFAVAGMLPDPNVGDSFVSGSASYNGTYEMLVIDGYDQSPDAATWGQETFEGPFSLTLSLEQDVFQGNVSSQDLTMTGQSADERLVFEDTLILIPVGDTPDTTTPTDFSGGTAFVNDEEVGLRGQVAFGDDGLVATFNGTGSSTLVAGGLLSN